MGTSAEETIRNDDILIVFMGPTGSGRSNMIDVLCGEPRKNAGHQLESCTRKIQSRRILNHPIKGDRIVLVDTPGFDDTSRSDMDILDMIAGWLADTYKKKIKISGILYFHRISDNRMSGSMLKILHMFKQLCGDDPARRVALVSTMWDISREDVATKRQNELEKKFWKPMIDLGSTTACFKNTYESAWEIIGIFLKPDQNSGEQRSLLIQQELVDKGLHLSETRACTHLYNPVQKILTEQKETVAVMLEKAVAMKSNSLLVQDLEATSKQIQTQFYNSFG